MNYDNFFPKILVRFRLMLLNWPLHIQLRNPSNMLQEEVITITNLLDNGTLKFAPITKAEVKDMIAERELRLENGNLLPTDNAKARKGGKGSTESGSAKEMGVRGVSGASSDADSLMADWIAPPITVPSSNPPLSPLFAPTYNIDEFNLDQSRPTQTADSRIFDLDALDNDIQTQLENLSFDSFAVNGGVPMSVETREFNGPQSDTAFGHGYDWTKSIATAKSNMISKSNNFPYSSPSRGTRQALSPSNAINFDFNEWARASNQFDIAGASGLGGDSPMPTFDDFGLGALTHDSTGFGSIDVGMSEGDNNAGRFSDETFGTF